MKIIILIVLVIFGLTAVACTSEVPSPADTQTASLPTPDVPEIDVVVTVLPSAYFWSGQSAGAVQISDKLIPTLQIGFRPRPVSYDTAGEWGSLGAHELAHVFGLPDLYPKNQSGYKGGFDIPSPPADMNWVWVEAGLMGLQGHYLAPESATRGFGRALAQEGDGSQTPTPESDGLFYEVDGDPPPSIGVDALNSRLVGIDFGQLSEVTKSLVSTRDPVTRTSPIPQTLVLNLFDDVEFIGIVEHVEPTSSGHALWGGLEGVELGTMTLVVNGSVVVGTVRTPGAVYSIRTAGGGAYVVRQIDESSLPPLGEPLEGPLSTPETRSESDDVPPDDGYMIDVMVVYTPLAKRREGGRAAIEALIDLFVAETNQAYANSRVTHRIRLVLREEVNYTEDGISIIDLDRLLTESDGHMDHVHDLRDLYAADLVHIVVGRSDVCGRAHFSGGESPAEDEASVFGLTVDSCGGLVFAHELGHNMGLSHDRYVEENPGRRSNFGYVNQRMFDEGAPGSARWRTIMAYNRQCMEVGGFYCPGIAYFSNPEVTLNGDPTGVPVDNPSTDVDGPAHAVKTLNERREITANFRRSSTSPTPRVHLTLSPYWLSENGGMSTVTATFAQAIKLRHDSYSDGLAVRRRHVERQQGADHSGGPGGEPEAL